VIKQGFTISALLAVDAVASDLHWSHLARQIAPMAAFLIGDSAPFSAIASLRQTPSLSRPAYQTASQSSC